MPFWNFTMENSLSYVIFGWFFATTAHQQIIIGWIAKQNLDYEMVPSVRLSVCINSLVVQLLRLSSLQNDHWQYLFQTSHVDRPWWVLPIVRFQVSRSNLLLRLSSLQNDHWWYLFQTSDVDRPWWVLQIVNFVCDLDLEGSNFQGQICYCV